MESDKINPWRDPRVFLALERTFLAWLRTGLALMGFGFVVARFGLLMREMAAYSEQRLPDSGAASTQFGTALVMIGVVVTVASAIQYRTKLARLDRGDDLHGTSRLAMSVAAVLAAAGALATLHLMGWI
jgi:putative membrane protein